jgi:DNA polymerase-3 subunit gamma/tau
MAVNENNAAQVITVANDLLDAGNSPAQLARQAVRYLRSCVIAKIAGLAAEGEETTELLQISTEEQRRAARTAALFGEEELTRFLQTMLRTFDEMGYRQEQRFHFELGLLKLVHLRRLLPVEEVLSSLSVRGASGAAKPVPGPVGVPRPAAASHASVSGGHSPVSAKPAFSPFEQDKNRRKFDNVPTGMSAGISSGANALASTPAPVAAPVPVAAPIAVVAPIPVVAPVPVIAPLPTPVALPEPVSMPEPVAAPQLPTVAAPEGDADAAGLQRAAVEALQAARQSSAADALEDASWTLSNGEARVETQLSKIMLPAVINPEAEKIARSAVRALGVMKLTLVAGAAAATAAAKKPKVAKAGSAQARALEHPLVQQAQRLFDAEIQTVIDLSGRD